MTVRYSILDPTGNITALAESPVKVEHQPEVAGRILRRHPEVEQVGFVRFFQRGADGDPSDESREKAWGRHREEVHGELRMAGGEFCGNASMSAAALYLLRKGSDATTERVLLRVSGAVGPVEVTLRREAGDCFGAEVRMPPARGIERRSFSRNGRTAELPVVRLEGISHAVIEQDSVFFSLKDDRAAAAEAVREWCAELGAEGLGLMFLETGPESNHAETGDQPAYRLTPLVFIPGGDTVYWENSCASGSAATAIYLAEKHGAAVDIRFQEPGGILCVKSGPARGETRLRGHVRMTGEYSMEIQE